MLGAKGPHGLGRVTEAVETRNLLRGLHAASLPRAALLVPACCPAMASMVLHHHRIHPHAAT